MGESKRRSFGPCPHFFSWRPAFGVRFQLENNSTLGEKMGNDKGQNPAIESADLTVGAQIALEYFGIAKSEILTRIRVRDTMLATYAAAAFTAIAAILASHQLGAHYLYGVPYLSLAFTLLVSYHHAGIGALGSHCAKDLLPTLTREGRILAFEHSSIFHQFHQKNATRRTIAHGMILLLPPAIALFVNYEDAHSITSETRQFTAMWYGGVGLMIVSAGVIYRSNRPHYRGVDHTSDEPSQSFFDALERV